MQTMNCQKCGAECVPGTSFCRQCGEPIAAEQTTALLNQTDAVTTHRLESRPTGPNPGQLRHPAGDSTAEKNVGSRRGLLLGALVIAIIGVITVAALIGMRKHSAASDDLIYPGARTVVDLKGEGGRALHLQTSDPFPTVEAWYQKTLKPGKTMRLTSTSVVLKNDTTTATIASEDNKTNILIKTK